MELEKVIERLEKQKSDWESKLAGYQKELAAINSKLPALEKERDGHILPARALGDAKAQVKLDSANIEVEKLKREQHELGVLVTEVQKEISKLEEQKKGYERQAQIFNLNAQRDKRADLAKEIERLINELLPVLAAYRDLGRDMYTLAKSLGAGHGGFYSEGKLASYVHGKVGKVLPSDFQGTLGRRVESLAKVDLQTVDTVLRAHGLTVETKKEAAI